MIFADKQFSHHADFTLCAFEVVRQRTIALTSKRGTRNGKLPRAFESIGPPKVRPSILLHWEWVSSFNFDLRPLKPAI